MEGNASDYRVYPVSRIAGEGRAEFLRARGRGFEQQGAGWGWGWGWGKTNICTNVPSILSRIFSSFFLLFLFSFFLLSGLFGCVLVPGTLAFHSLDLDELRLLFGSLCLTVVYHHMICISMKNQHQHWVYYCCLLLSLGTQKDSEDNTYW